MHCWFIKTLQLQGQELGEVQAVGSCSLQPESSLLLSAGICGAAELASVLTDPPHDPSYGFLST